MCSAIAPAYGRARPRSTRLEHAHGQRAVGVGGQRAHDLRRRRLARQRVRLAGPQVQQLGVAALARRRAQRRREVVDVGVGAAAPARRARP